MAQQPLDIPSGGTMGGGVLGNEMRSEFLRGAQFGSGSFENVTPYFSQNAGQSAETTPTAPMKGGSHRRGHNSRRKSRRGSKRRGYSRKNYSRKNKCNRSRRGGKNKRGRKNKRNNGGKRITQRGGYHQYGSNIAWTPSLSFTGNGSLHGGIQSNHNMGAFDNYSHQGSEGRI